MGSGPDLYVILNQESRPFWCLPWLTRKEGRMPELLIRRNVQLAADKSHPFPRDLKRRPTPKGSVVNTQIIK